MTKRGLIVENLVIGYDTALRAPTSFSVPPGAVLAVVGPSGCGKSTLLSTIAGVTPALGGRVVIDGRDVSHMPIQQRRIGMVFQEPLLFPHLNVVDNVAYGPRRAGQSRDQARETARELLSWVGLEDLTGRDVTRLSGGQAQRVALARALAAHPDVLCLDEPFSALDAPLRDRLAKEVSNIVARAAIPAIHVTHDPQEAAAMAANNPGGSILSM